MGIALNPDGSRLYTASLSSNAVSVIDTASNLVVATISVGAAPMGVAVTPNGTRVYVTNTQSSSVSVIDTATDTVIHSVAVGSFPLSLGRFIGPNLTTASPQPVPALSYTALLGVVLMIALVALCKTRGFHAP